MYGWMYLSKIYINLYLNTNSCLIHQTQPSTETGCFPVWSFGFLQRICRLFKHYRMHYPTGGIFCGHIHPRTHATPITFLPRQRAVGAGQQRQSIDWVQRSRRWEELQAINSRGGKDLSEISAPRAFCPHLGCYRLLRQGPSHTKTECYQPSLIQLISINNIDN